MEQYYNIWGTKAIIAQDLDINAKELTIDC